MTNQIKYPDCTDRELWELWRASDSRAGSQFCDRYFFQVYRFFTSKVKEDCDAEDLTQKTFLELTRAVTKAEPEHLRAYILGVARFVLIAHFGRKTKLAAAEIPAATVEQIDPGPGLSTMFRRSSEREQLVKALQRLPLDAQIALELFYWEDMSGADVARVLGIPEPTFRGRLRRARELLSEQLKDGGADDSEQRMRDVPSWIEELQQKRRK